MHINTQVAEAMMQVKTAYLNATLNQIKKQFGSVYNYLSTQINLTNDMVEKLKESYLE